MVLRFPSRQNESDTMQSSRFIIAMGVGALAAIGVIAGSTSVSGVVALAVALLVVLSSASEEDAVSIINRIGQLISQIQVNEEDTVKITATTGITSYHGTEEVPEMMENVVKALQAAVGEARNLVAIYNYKDAAED